MRTRTLRDGKKIPLGKLSPVAKRSRRTARKAQATSESEVQSQSEKYDAKTMDMESEMTEANTMDTVVENKISVSTEIESQDCGSSVKDVLSENLDNESVHVAIANIEIDENITTEKTDETNVETKNKMEDIGEIAPMESKDTEMENGVMSAREENNNIMEDLSKDTTEFVTGSEKTSENIETSGESGKTAEETISKRKESEKIVKTQHKNIETLVESGESLDETISKRKDKLVEFGKSSNEAELECKEASAESDKPCQMEHESLDSRKSSVEPEEENKVSKVKEAPATHSPVPQEETPKKFKAAKKRSLTGLVSSDSKVIGLSRLGLQSAGLMSVRGFNIVRRSILQQRNTGDDQNKVAPYKSVSPSKSLISRSPSASPSTGILKRRLSTDSPSPPAKHRRVSFATPIVEGKSPVKFHEITTMPPSPLISNVFTQISTNGSKFLVGSPSHRKNKPSVLKDSEDSESQFSQSQPFKCTDETKLSSEGPAFPEFIDCDIPVDKILPQLTSSVWSRGLVQLIRSSVKNMNTVGDLCRLSEYEINNLPIRHPKLATVHKALTMLDYKKPEESTPPSPVTTGMKGESESKASNIQYGLTTVIEDEEGDELPSADEALQKLADATSQPEDCDQEDQLRLSQSSDCSQSLDCSQSEKPSQQTINKIIETSDNNVIEPNNLLDTIKSIAQSGAFDALSDIRTGTLFQMHQHLTSFTNKVVAALQSKCHSPNNSQDKI